MTFNTHIDGAIGSIAVGPGLSGTSFALTSGDGAKFDGAPPFSVTIWAATDALPKFGSAEIVLITGLSGDTVTSCTRSYKPFGGSSDPVNIGNGFQIASVVISEDFTRLESLVGGAAQKSADLSDLGSAGTARSNLA